MRTTVEDVRLILTEDNTDLTDEQIISFINSASLFVTTNLLGSGLTEEVLTDIEKWLTAHFISATLLRPTKKEKAGSAEAEYYNVLGQNLLSTAYGQVVLTLDSTGTLAALSQLRKKASIKAVPGSGGN